VCGGRIARTFVIASLSVAAVACGSSSPLPAVGDGSVKSDATVPKDATTRTDAAAQVPEAGPLDGQSPVDAGPFDAREPADASPSDAGPDLCANKSCGQNEVCAPSYGACVCASNFVALSGEASCVPAVCNADADCDDGNACNGVETCEASTHHCLAGTPVECGAYGTCVSMANVASCQCASGSIPGSDGACTTVCPIPLAPDLSVIADNEILNFAVSDGSPVEIAVLPAAASISTAVFQPASSLSLTALSGLTRVLAQTTATGCAPTPFNAVYDVGATYAPPPPDPTTTAVAYNDPRIVGWAEGCASYLQGPGVTDSQFATPSEAFGPAGTNTLAVVSLGNGGSITLTFDAPITDGDGWDFAVYENSFASDVFLELGFVEVSSDGSQFARFDSAFQSMVTPSVDSSGTAAQIGGLAGSYMVGYGTPFDLAALRNSPLVRDGAVNLTSIKYVRIVDIIGDGTTLDSFGRGIVDPLSSGPTAGFDLDGIAVLNQRM
jgi:hypothetical protein